MIRCEDDPGAVDGCTADAVVASHYSCSFGRYNGSPPLLLGLVDFEHSLPFLLLRASFRNASVNAARDVSGVSGALLQPVWERFVWWASWSPQ